MKTKFSLKTIALILSIIMLLSCTLSVYAVDKYDTFSGEIVTQSDMDLSDIEIQVYSAIPIYDTSSNEELLYYAETYEYSVYTDETGFFEFVKPTQYCSLSVVLDTLPINYGISKKTQFIAPWNTSIELELSIVNTVNVTIMDGTLTPKIYDVAGNTLLASYTIIPSNESLVSSLKNTASSKLSLKYIDNISSYYHKGIVQIGSKNFSYIVEERLDDLSVVNKIDFLTAVNYLSEAEKISLYCDILNSTDYAVECGTPIYSSIMEYTTKNNTLDYELWTETMSVTATPTPSYTDYIEASIGTYKIRVFYNTNKGMKYDIASNILSECVSIYKYFVTNNGFKAPIPYDSTSYFAIYLVDNNYMTDNGHGTANAFTQSNGNKSRIIIRYSVASSSASNYKRTISHEFSHSVMHAYGILSTSSNIWFHESFASMSALVYCGSTQSWFDNMVKNYLSHSYRSIYSTDSTNHIYGALVFPLYIYTYLGGWTTIKDIYGKFASAGNEYDAISNSTYISNYRTAFLASVSRNYKPQSYYYQYATSAWGTGAINDFAIPFASSTNMAVSPMACHYQRFSSTSNIGTVYFTIEITSNSSSGMMLNKVTETSTGTLSISTVSSSFSRITVQQSNFGSTIQKLTLVPVNTNSSGSSITYSLTASS